MNRREMFKALAGVVAGAGAAKAAPTYTVAVHVDGKALAEAVIPRIKRELLSVTDLIARESYDLDRDTGERLNVANL